MRDDEIAPGYAEVGYALQQASASTSAAEAHGILCGFICAGKEMDGKSWIEPILGSQTVSNEVLDENRALLLKLYEISSIKLQMFELNFSLLLPDDSEALQIRAEALSHWCQGFIIALNRSGINLRTAVSDEVRDALKQMLEISKLDYDIIAVNEEDERAYFEVVEYVRMAVLMVYTEIASEQGTLGDGGSVGRNRLH